MFSINKNVSQLKPSATLLINEAIKKLRNNGKHVYHFGFGQSPFPISKQIVKELQKKATNNHYLPTAGLPKLRDEIAYFLIKHQNVQTSGEFVFIGPGSKELLYQTILMLDGTYLIPKGSWVSYLPQVKASNKRAVILETFFDNNFKLKPEALKTYCTENTKTNKYLILNSPNNPSGAVYSKTELKELAQVCRKYNVIVLSDEIYSQVCFDTKYAPSMSNYYPENTIVYGGLSKVFSAGGYRLGYMVLPKNLHSLQTNFQSLFSETFSAVSAPIQHAAVVAYKYDEKVKKHVEASVDILNLIGNYVYSQLTNAGIECTKPQGGFYVLIGFNSFTKKLKAMGLATNTDLSNYLLANFSVALLPGVDFYFSSESYFFRLAYVDFNGKKALKAYAKNDVSLNTNFVETYAPNVVIGVQKITKFVSLLK